MADYLDEGDSWDVYGRGKLLNEFESEVATVLGKEAGLLLHTGIMAQGIALKVWHERAGAPADAVVGLHPTSHLVLHEEDALQQLWGIASRPLGSAIECVRMEDVHAFMAALKEEEGEPSALAIVIELPQRENGGVAVPYETLVELRAWADDKGVKLHLDGARLWETRPFYKRDYSEIAALFDSVYVSFYKGLGAVVGAMLCGAADFIAEARVWARRAGGNPYHATYLADAMRCFRTRLTTFDSRLERLQSIVAALTDACPRLRFLPPVPHVPMVRIILACADEEEEEDETDELDARTRCEAAGKAAEQLAATVQLPRLRGLAGAMFAPPHLVGSPIMELTMGPLNADIDNDKWVSAFTAWIDATERCERDAKR
eukprot:PLAT6596.1.p1 GENE.PLAT6596.1~~PLAT6596.1.p1  ORF type:complete len:408 (+),score=158.85 PLAT6596.1:104-1225(+)